MYTTKDYTMKGWSWR